MKKQEFEAAVRNELKKTPLETRKAWTGDELFAWWLKTRNENSYLTWERAPGDLWQHVSGFCNDLIGERAVW